MSKTQNGDTIKIYYKGKLEDGNIFDNSSERQPLEFKVGNGDVIPGIEKGVIGMETGDTKTIEIAPDEAYGPRRKDLVIEVPKSDLPDENSTMNWPLMRPAFSAVITLSRAAGTRTFTSSSRSPSLLTGCEPG